MSDIVKRLRMPCTLDHQRREAADVIEALMASNAVMRNLLHSAGGVLREAPSLPLELMDAEHLNKWTDAISELCMVLVDYISPKETK